MTWLAGSIAIAIAMLGTPVAAVAAEDRMIATACPVDQGLSDLAAGSDLIVLGRMDLPTAELSRRAQQKAPEWLNIPVEVTRTLKGEDSKKAIVRVYPVDETYKPSNAALLQLAGAPSLLFLTRVDEGEAGLYFAGYTPSALRPGSESEVAAVTAEVARQNEILRVWRTTPSAPHERAVRDLLSRLGQVKGGAQQQLFDRLVALGPEAVPALVSQMDDRRPLAEKSISLVNHAADAFEGTRHYGPELVVDALDAILNQITGASFGSIVNGGSDRERAATVAGWRVYAADLHCRESASKGR
ncbi:MAG: hypothetical protein WC729_10770 [Sphingomonas sp.]|uniref:hypothetical protein n=1 Tax=Sphingomonas sp. TaxID=28214 RepID=UPI00356A45D3